jgi:hypothetical protein
MTYRNPAILRLAKHTPCQLCGKLDGTVVAAHSNQGRHGKGMGMKANDSHVAYLCHGCHYEIDQGKQLSKHAKAMAWQLAHERSLPLYQHLLGEEGHRLIDEGNGDL